MFKRLFKTEDYLGARKKNYFEGWYYRHSGKYPFSLIVGVSRADGDPHSFVQYIDCDRSHYFRFDLQDFSFDKQGMTARIGKNSFSLSGVSAHLSGEGLKIDVDVKYSDMVRYKKTAFAPSVMGPFTYLPMVCNHCVVSMAHECEGTLTVGGEIHQISGRGYIEKDFGSAFPSNYFWTHIDAGDTSIMFAVAWPLIFGIKGHLCIISHKGKQYNLSYYSGSKLTGLSVKSDAVSFKLTKGTTALTVKLEDTVYRQPLIAPARGGNMNIPINETLSASATELSLTLKGKEIPLDNVIAAFESVLIV